MTILLEFYDIYSLRQILNILNTMSTKNGYLMRKNPTLEGYADLSYHGIIYVYVSINKVVRTMSVKMNGSAKNADYETRCESGWERIVEFNLQSGSESFSLPSFEFDLSRLSEDIRLNLMIRTTRGLIYSDKLFDPSQTLIGASLIAKPEYAEVCIPEDGLKELKFISSISQSISSNLFQSICNNQRSATSKVGVFMVDPEMLTELCGCELDSLKLNLDRSRLAKFGTNLMNASGINSMGAREFLFLDGAIIPSESFEEAVDTGLQLFFKMIQKLPKESFIYRSFRVSHVRDAQIYFISDPAPAKTAEDKEKCTYLIYMIKHTGEIIKVYVKLEPEKITVYDEVLN